MLIGWKKSGNTHLKMQKTKLKLLEELSKTVKELQKQVLDSGGFDISRNDESALHLTCVLEAIFLHGHQSSTLMTGIFSKSSSSGVLPSPDFWEILHPFIHKDVLHQLSHLSHVTTQVGKCRAWLRLALNDGVTESYLHAILSEKKKISQHYSPKAFLTDDEATSILMNHFLGLTELNFDLNYNTPSLNQWTATALLLSGTWEPPSAPSATMAQPAEVPRPLSIPKAAIQTNARTAASSLSNSGTSSKERRKVRKHTDHQRNMKMEETKQSSENSAEKVPQPIELKKNDNEEISEKREAEDILSASPAVEASTTPSPTSHPGGNMLGMGSGWSSTFEPEPASQMSADHPKTVTVISEGESVKPAASFHGILSDYAVTGSKKFATNQYTAQFYPLQGGQNGLNEMEKSLTEGLFDREKASGYEIIADSSSPEEGFMHERYMGLLASVNDIPREKGLDKQNYKCKGCSRPIGMIYGRYKVCSYDGSYYCYECHVDDEHVIPARIIHNWDLAKYKVAKQAKLFLMQIDEEPLFHIDEVNPTLYNVINEINKAKQLRIQLQHLKGYVLTCRSIMISEEVKRRMWPREYLWDDIHQYSLLDLIQVNSGQLQHHLKKIISFCKKHVYGCEVCSQKGFICEICKNPKIVYAFELNYTSQCPRCKAVFHKSCKIDRQCPRCIRRRSRRQSPNASTAKHEQSNLGLNSLF